MEKITTITKSQVYFFLRSYIYISYYKILSVHSSNGCSTTTHDTWRTAEEQQITTSVLIGTERVNVQDSRIKMSTSVSTTMPMTFSIKYLMWMLILSIKYLSWKFTFFRTSYMIVDNMLLNINLLFLIFKFIK